MRVCRVRGFNLVEVVVALGVTSFVLVAILGLCMVGMQTSKESSDEIKAINMLSRVLAVLRSSPEADIPNYILPKSAMTQPYDASSMVTDFIDIDGKRVSSTEAEFRVTYRAGKINDTPGAAVSLVYIMLSWPPSLEPGSAAAGRYELVTWISVK